MSSKFLKSLMCIALTASFTTTFDVDNVLAAQKKKRKNLLEALFPKAAERARQKRLRQKQRLLGIKKLTTTKKTKIIAATAAIKKIEGPTYYTYQPEKYRNISTKKIVLAVQSAQKNRIAAQELSHTKKVLSGDTHPLHEASGKALDMTNTGAVAFKIELNEKSLRKTKILAERNIAKAIENHYTKHPQHIWLDEDYELTADAKNILYAFKRADAYGLNEEHYNISSIEKLMSQGASLLDAATEFELAFTSNILRYMADAKDGVINPNKISGYHDFGAYNRRYEDHLENLLKAGSPAKAMFGAHPQNAQFKAMRKELFNLQSVDDEVLLEPIKKGTFIRPGQSHDELPNIVKAIAVKGSKTLNKTHSQTITSYTGSPKYNEAVTALVKDFQKENKLKPDGIIGKNTLFKLVDDSPRNRIERVKLAMERLRWLPVNLGYKHVFINQPAYNASYMVNNKPRLSMRAIVGKQSNQTNFFYDTIETVEVNPYWNVPRSILVNEKLRKLQRDPYYYDRRGFEVLKYGKTKPVDPGSVNWYNEKTTKKYYVRQKPGGSNALGDVKILFPNKHNIYMHDTPSRGLFKRSNRALSHGCVRLHKPREMAAAVMGTKVSKMNSLISKGKNKAMRVPKKMPVYVSYFTAWPNYKGEVKYYPDIYGRDKALGKAFKATDKTRKTVLSS